MQEKQKAGVVVRQPLFEGGKADAQASRVTVDRWLVLVACRGICASAIACDRQSAVRRHISGRLINESEPKLRPERRNDGLLPGGDSGRADHRANRLSYTTESGRRLDGTVGANGEIQIQYAAPTTFQPIRVNVRGFVDGSGNIRVRQEGNSCSYDIVWQKRS